MLYRTWVSAIKLISISDDPTSVREESTFSNDRDAMAKQDVSKWFISCPEILPVIACARKGNG